MNSHRQPLSPQIPSMPRINPDNGAPITQIVLGDPIPEMCEAAPMKRAQIRLAIFLPGRAMSPSTV